MGTCQDMVIRQLKQCMEFVILGHVQK
jgi:hypothetical protein